MASPAESSSRIDADQPAEPAQVSVRLGARGLCRSYGSVRANRNINLEVAPEEIHAIVGENGAGKSTLMRMLQGLEVPDSGEVIVDDQPRRLTGPQDAFHLGIGMVHQEFMLAPDLTLLENLVLGDEPASGFWGQIDWADARTTGDRLASEVGMEIDWDRRAADTPVHIRQFVEIVRLLRRGTRILILDEPTAVLAPQQVEDLLTLLKILCERGTTIIFISHKLHEVMSVADRISVMRRGEITYSALAHETDMDALAGHVIGEGLRRSRKSEPVEPLEQPAATPGKPVLTVERLSAAAMEGSQRLKDISLTVHTGEIVGLAGVSGNGQHELVQCLVGLAPHSKGSITLSGEDVSHADTKTRRDLGMGYVSADRRHEGLALDATIEVNTLAASQRDPALQSYGLLNRNAMRETALTRLRSLRVLFGKLGDMASSLSGGNQQRLVFAREIATNPDLLIVSQPTRGVDISGIEAIHTILRDFSQRGGAVLLVSEELDEIIALSSRICVIADGEIVGETKAGEADMQALGRMMLVREVPHA